MAQLKPLAGTDYYLWRYLPSIPASVVFIVAFAAVTGFHSWQIVKTRCWFCIPFAIGGLFQVIGYATRIYAYWHTDQLAAYSVQGTFIVIPPVFYAASIYMALGRLIRRSHGENLSIIRPNWVTKIFVTGDILALNMQGSGVGLSVRNKTAVIGKAIVLSGLGFQLVLFVFFVVVAVTFDKRMRRQAEAVKDANAPRSNSHILWRQELKMLYACSGLIIVRSVFRTVEYAMGNDGYLLATEWPIYVFDAVLMWAVQVIFVIWFPHQLKPRQCNGSEDGHELVENVPQSS